MVKVISVLGSTTVKWLKRKNLKHQCGLLEIHEFPHLPDSSYLLLPRGVCVPLTC